MRIFDRRDADALVLECRDGLRGGGEVVAVEQGFGPHGAPFVNNADFRARP